MKRIVSMLLALVLALILSISFFGCGVPEAAPDTNDAVTVTDDDDLLAI